MLISSRCMCEVVFVVDQKAEQVCGSFQASKILTPDVSWIDIIIFTVTVSVIINLHVFLNTHTYTQVFF